MHTQCYEYPKGTGDFCDNIGLVGVSTKWSYVTASPSHHDKAIPILSPLLMPSLYSPFHLPLSPPFFIETGSDPSIYV